MRCEELMRRPVQSVGLEESLEAAARKMRDANVGFLVVCDRGGRGVGTLTDRDLAVRACAENMMPSRTEVVAIMSHGIVCCGPHDDLAEAVACMMSARRSRVVVTDDSSRPQGVLSLSDIATRDPAAAARALAQIAAREVLGEHGTRQHPAAPH